MSDTTLGKLAAALAKAQGAMSGAAKDSANPFFKSKYADLASCWEACRKPLSDNELSIVQLASAEGAAVTITTVLMHSSGESLSSALTMTSKDDTPQGIGSAITYGRRYALCAMVGIAPEDDDGNAASKTRPQAVPVGMPKGYDEWRADMETLAADEGLPAVAKAFKSSPEIFRDFATKHDADRWAALKAKASKVPQEVSA